MRPSRTRKIASGLLTLAVLAGAWHYFAPAAVGGSTNYVVTDGVSMEPRFHAGDLALVRGQSEYRVGEIVAYHNNGLHTVVLHRIVGREGPYYVFKGDNNNFTDFERPLRSQLIGALWLHIPGAGADLASIRSPGLVGGLVGLSVLLFAGAAFTHRRRLRQRERRGSARPWRARQPTSTPRPRARPVPARARALTVLACGALALAPFVALGVLAFGRRARTELPYAVSYRQSANLSYAAAATPGPVYPGNRAITGDPLFTHVLGSVQFRFAYRFAAGAPHALGGRAWLAAAVASTSGWRRTLALGPPQAFRGDGAVVEASLDLSALQALLRQVETSTAVSGTYTLTLVPHVSLAGELAGRPLRTTFSPQVHFTLDEYELQPVVSGGVTPAAGPSGGAATGNPFAPASEGSMTGRRLQPALVSLGPGAVPVGTLRLLAGVGAALVALVTLLALALARPRRRTGRAAAIRARYGRLIVPVAHVEEAPGQAVIDVADIEALARIAEHYDRSILYESAQEAFWVSDESGQFRYAVEEDGWEQQESADWLDPHVTLQHETPPPSRAPEPQPRPQRESTWRTRRRVSV